MFSIKSARSREYHWSSSAYEDITNNPQSPTPMKGLRVACNSLSSQGGGVLSFNHTFQHFARVSYFKSIGEFYFTIIIRIPLAKKPTPCFLDMLVEVFMLEKVSLLI